MINNKFDINEISIINNSIQWPISLFFDGKIVINRDEYRTIYNSKGVIKTKSISAYRESMIFNGMIIGFDGRIYPNKYNGFAYTVMGHIVKGSHYIMKGGHILGYDGAYNYWSF